jgi:diacylglycerol O-acyltransferase
MKIVAPADLMFLLLETAKSPMHVAGLNIYTPPANAPATFVADLLSSWKRHRKALPPFNQRAVQHMGMWCWEEDKQFDLKSHIQHLTLPESASMDDLMTLVARLHSDLLDRQRPLWQACIIEGLPGGRFATYVKIHHALVDGVSGARMIAQNLSRDPDEKKAPFWAYHFPEHPAASTSTKAKGTGLLDEISKALHAGQEIIPGMLDGVWDILRPAHPETGVVLPLQAPPTPFNIAIGNSRSFAAQPYSLRRLQQLGHACGATVNDIALAICAGALRQYLLTHHSLPKRSLIAMVPVSLHEEGSAEGNQIGLLLANLATNIADPRKRLQAIVQSTRSAKQHLQNMARLEKWSYIAPMAALAAPLMISGQARRHPLFNVIISDVPGPRETLYLNGAQLQEVYPVSIPADYLNLNITFTGYGDILGFGYIACSHAVPDAQCLVDYSNQALVELEHVLLGKSLTPGTRARASRVAKPASSSRPHSSKAKTRSP